MELDAEAGLHFDNSGKGLLRVPGIGLPLFAGLVPGERFAHGATDWAQPRSTARELAMLGLINDPTDEPGWEVGVLDDDVVAAWRRDALARPLISAVARDWCLAELRDKAVLFAATKYVLVLDNASGVVKSDVLLGEGALGTLRKQTAVLGAPATLGHRPRARSSGSVGEVAEAAAEPLVLDLIDPGLFPLVYEITRVLQDGLAVGRTLYRPLVMARNWPSSTRCLDSMRRPFWTASKTIQIPWTTKTVTLIVGHCDINGCRSRWHSTRTSKE